MQNYVVKGYQIQEELGRGAFGRVFRARHETTERDVAIKFLQFEEHLNTEDVETQRVRFEREIQLCSTLQHPHIVQLLDKGQSESISYAVFEYIKGETLKSLLLREGGLPSDEAGRLMSEVLDALVCAHQQGVVHRDIKPQNIMLTHTGSQTHAKLLDYGIGTWIPQARRADYLMLTKTHQAIGTPSYSAPEQLRGLEPTTQSDIYAWALVLIEAITGKPLMQGLTVADIVHKQMSPEIVQLPKAIAGHPLANLLRRALEKKPSDRINNAQQLYNELTQLNLRNLIYTDTEINDSRQNDLTRTLLNEVPGNIENRSKRQITLLLCCIDYDSKNLQADMDVKEMESVTTCLHQQQSEYLDIACRFGAYNAGSLHENILLYFGYPQVKDTDTKSAARAALAIRECHRHYQHEHEIKSELRCTLHTGPALVGTDGYVRGLAPNQLFACARMTKPDDIQVTATAKHILEPYMDFAAQTSDRGTFHLLQETQIPALAFDPERDNPIIGRTTEFEYLQSRWNQAKSGSGSVLLLCGEAGVGKSRLVYEMKQRVEHENHSVLECRFQPELQNNSLYPFIEYLKSKFNIKFDQSTNSADSTSLLIEALSQCACDLDKTVPQMCQWLGLPIPTRFPKLELSPAQYHTQLLDTITALLILDAPQQGLLLIVEDLHWQDPTSYTLLSHLITTIPRHLFLLLTTRPLVNISNKLELIGLHTNDTLTLGGLVPQAAQQMIIQVLDNAAIHNDALTAIVKHTDGIPLFIEEFTRMLLVKNILLIDEQNKTYVLSQKLDQSSIPTTLKNSLSERLDMLGAALETAQLAAAMGREFDLEILISASRYLSQNYPDSQCKDDITVQKHLQILVDANLLIRQVYQEKKNQNDYLFRHALIRDSAYESQLSHYRERNHLALAVAMQKEYQKNNNTTQVDTIAYHFTRAGDYDKATEYWLRAGQSALQRSVNFEAVAHLTQGFELFSSLPQTDNYLQRQLQYHLARGPALMMTKGFSCEEVKTIYLHAEHLSELLGQTEELFPIIWGLFAYYNTRGELQTSETYTRKLVALSNERKDNTLEVPACHALGYATLYQGKYSEALELVRRAEKVFDWDNERKNLLHFQMSSTVSVYNIAGNALWMLGFAEQGLIYADQSISLARELLHPPSVTFAISQRVRLYAYDPQPEKIIQASEELKCLSDRDKNTFWTPVVMIYSGWGKALQGDLINGLESMQQGLSLYKERGLGITVTEAHMLIAEIQLQLQHYDEALATVAKGLNIINTSHEHHFEPALYRSRAEILLAQSSHLSHSVIEQAKQALQTSMQLATSQQSRWMMLATSNVKAELALHLQDEIAIDSIQTDLQEQYDWFSEGHQTALLQKTNDILTQLNG